MYTYIFHRRVYDGTFHIAYENKDLILPGLFGAKNETILDSRISELLEVAERRLPAVASRIRIRPEPCHVDPCRVPLLAKISANAIESVSKVCFCKTIYLLQNYRAQNFTEFYILLTKFQRCVNFVK